jgi:aspartyl-tRNA(Asn)/glutamyl-tRNA(Gln) amidotransferase subunit A
VTSEALNAEVVAALAEVQGLGPIEAATAARIGVGAANAVRAVVASLSSSVVDTEPSAFAAELERLADRWAPSELNSSTHARRAPSVAAAVSSPLDLSLSEVALELTAGRISSLELSRAAIARAVALQPKLNCFIATEPEHAEAAAKAADDARSAGKVLGPLHGVPLAHKDMYYTAGRVTDCGSRARRGFVPQVTATPLQRMSDAGAVCIGRLNMTEFALGPTGHNAFWGDCRNPWNTAHISAGSSSGSGAAVAARIVTASLGSDTGGSTRLPACVNGLVGLKPTYSLISRFGSMGLSFSADTPGPLARTARDLALLLEVIAGNDPLDPTSCRARAPRYLSALMGDIRGMKIGVPANYFFDGVASDVGAALDAALAVFRSLGAEIVAVRVPRAEHLSELSRALVYSEATALHAYELKTRPNDYSSQVRVRASTGLAIPAAAYLDALHIRPALLREFVAETLGACDVLFAPTLTIPVPTLAETGVGAGDSMWAVIAKLVHCTAPFNYLGVPALSVPAGFSRSGLPVGFQLIGRPFGEARLLAVADAYQLHTDWHLRAPPLLAR